MNTCEELQSVYEQGRRDEFQLKETGESTMRTYDTGATRGADEIKPDYEGYLSSLVIRRYGKFMLYHQTQADGKERDSDNWQKGIPIKAYMKSLWRHLVDLWTLHRGISIKDKILGPVDTPEADRITVTKEDALCAIIFNASGYLHELLKAKREIPEDSACLHDLADFPEE